MPSKTHCQHLSIPLQELLTHYAFLLSSIRGLLLLKLQRTAEKNEECLPYMWPNCLCAQDCENQETPLEFHETQPPYYSYYYDLFVVHLHAEVSPKIRAPTVLGILQEVPALRSHSAATEISTGALGSGSKAR
ncbi:unnamed protein product [Natator depressus]